MSRPKAAPRVAAANVTASLAALLGPARAEAGRKSGARSKGPKTQEGKARSAQNALKHGLRAQKFVVVGDEDPQEFAAFEAALLDDLAPVGALQTLLAGRLPAPLRQAIAQLSPPRDRSNPTAAEIRAKRRASTHADRPIAPRESGDACARRHERAAPSAEAVSPQPAD